MVFWLIGLSGAGKTYIGKALTAKLKQDFSNVIFLDGDIIRQIIGDNLGYDLEARMESGWRICRLCQHLDAQGMIVVCSVISLFECHREWNRKTYSRYHQTFIDVDINELIERDSKGLYSGYEQGIIEHVAGMDLQFINPIDSNLVIKNNRPFSDPMKIADLILSNSNFNQAVVSSDV